MSVLLLQGVLWLLAVQAAGLAVLPLAGRIFQRMPDRGYGLARVLGLLSVTYVIWFTALLGYLDYRRTTILAALIVLTLLSWRAWGAECSRWLRCNRGLIVAEEAIFIGALAAGLFVRAYNSDIIGQEKFMDLAFFNGFLAATDLPAEDAWLSGYGMPYYPFGYLLLSLPTKLAGLPGAYGYNLALVLVFALVISASTALVANLLALLRHRSVVEIVPTRVEWFFGLIGAALIAICGNLVGPLEVAAARGLGSPEFWSAVGVKNLEAARSAISWLPADGAWWWHASRVIPTIQPDGITEFPYFSFLLGDLHPHFTSLPLLILIAALVLELLLGTSPRQDAAWLGVAGLALGAPIAANPWDIPTFWTLFGAAALLLAWRAGSGRVWKPYVLALAPLPLAIVLYSPYFIGFSSQRLGLALTSERTPLGSLLVIFGPFLLLTMLLAARLLGRARPPLFALVAAVIAIVFALVIHSTFAVAAGLALLFLALGQRLVVDWRADPTPSSSSAALFTALVAALAWSIVATAEIAFLRDSFGTRMNTVFKFYYHVWLLLGLIAAPALGLSLLRSSLGVPRAAFRAVGGLMLGLVVAVGLVYPLAATWSKSNGFLVAPTLDGAAFLERSKPADAAAIQWLASRPGRPVVVEAIGGDYQEYARVSTFSGLPTILGWIGHQLQWRGQLDEFDRRQRDVDSLYSRADREEVMRVLHRYRARFVFVGSLERERYGDQVIPRLGQWLSPAFQSEGTTVFAVPEREERS
jgi:YYY domain-containing protein